MNNCTEQSGGEYLIATLARQYYFFFFYLFHIFPKARMHRKSLRLRPDVYEKFSLLNIFEKLCAFIHTINVLYYGV